jgi:signal transduction histidine kinase
MELKFVKGTAVLRVFDDGDVRNSPPTEELALTHMREQVLALDGTLEIASSPSNGTVIEVSIPVKSDPSGSALV